LKEKVIASAPGKIILTGEHFVVHGAYSVAAAINKRVRVSISEASERSYIVSGNSRSFVDQDDGRFVLIKAILGQTLEERRFKNTHIAVSVSSEIPAGSGLGSSAAVSVATAAAALKFSDSDSSPRKIFEVALSGEKKVHGNPSGIDVETSLQGGIILFNRIAGAKPIPLDRSVHFLVVYSGKPRRTSTLISRVALRKKQFPNFFDCLTRSASFLSLEVVDAISAGDLPRLGALMNISQATLSWIGVSTSAIDRLVEDIAAQDVFGVKLTGAGGGGSVLALPQPNKIESLSRFMSNNFPYCFVTPIPQEGLRWET
jgi:mevalonate kinase